jgi:hypothetical protein
MKQTASFWARPPDFADLTPELKALIDRSGFMVKAN